MTLASIIEAAERRRTSAVHYAAEPGDLAEQFDARNVEIRFRELPPGGPDPFLVIRKGEGTFRGATRVERLREFLHPSGRPPREPGEHPPGYRALFDLLDDTVFASLTRRQLLVTSREIEDRARRTGRGTLRAGFQSLSAFRAQRSVYRALAGTTDLDVHVYAVDAERGDLAEPGPTVHTEPKDEIGRYWFLAFDGGGDDGRKCALVAEQCAEGTFYGVWTYSPELVDRVLDALA